MWRRSRPLLLAGTSATTASDLAVFLNGVSGGSRIGETGKHLGALIGQAVLAM